MMSKPDGNDLLGRIVLSIVSPFIGAVCVAFTLGMSGKVYAVNSFVDFLIADYYIIFPAMMIFGFIFLTVYDYYHTEDDPTANPS